MGCQRFRSLVIVASFLLATGCGSPKDTTSGSDSKSAEISHDTSQFGALEEFLRDPPRLPRDLRIVVAREISRPAQGKRGLQDFGRQLAQHERSLRADGLLPNEADRSVDSCDRQWDGRSEHRANTIRQIETSAVRSQHALNRALRTRTHRVEVLGIELILRRIVQTAGEAKLEDLFSNVDGFEGDRIDHLMTKAGKAEAESAYKQWSSLQSQYERARRKNEPLDALRQELRTARLSVLAAFEQATITYRQLFELGGLQWSKLTDKWEETAPGVFEMLAKRTARLTVLSESARLMQAGRSVEESQEEFVQLAQEAARINAGLNLWTQDSRSVDAALGPSAGVADALELALRGLERLQYRQAAAQFGLQLQPITAASRTRLLGILQQEDSRWSDITSAAGIRAADFETALQQPLPPDHIPEPFFREELRKSLDRDTAANRATASQAAAAHKRLLAMTSSLSEQTILAVHAIVDGVQDAQQDVTAVLEAEQQADTASLRAQIADDLMHDSDAIGRRIQDIESGAELYEPLSDEARSEILVALERHQRRDGSDGEDHSHDPAASAQKKWGDRISQAEEAVKAAKDVTEMLVTLDIIPVEDANQVLRGLDAASAGLTIATGLMSGNVFDVISGAAQMVSILTGKEPPPDIDQLRHEQVMLALNSLAEGQRVILQNLEVLSRQIEELHAQLDDVQRIVLATHRLMIDEQLQGLRLAQDFVDARRFYATNAAGALSTDRLRAMLPQDYKQWTAHFRKHRHAYVAGRRFLDDTVRETPLELTRLATDLVRRDNSASMHDLPPDWQQSLEQDEQRINALRNFSRWIDPAIRPAVLGSLTEPAMNHTSLVRKLELLADRESAAAHVWGAAFSAARLEQSLWNRFNPRLVTQMSELIVAIQPYRLIDQGVDFSGQMPTFGQLSAPGFDPSTTFGASPEHRHDQLLAPLREAERMLLSTTAQNALVQGDVLLPLLALLAMSDSWRCDAEDIRHAAERVLISHPILRHNALRFLVYLHRHHPPADRERIVSAAMSLLRAEVRGALRPTIVVLIPDHDRTSDAYRRLVEQPLPESPGLLLIAHRLPDEWAMQRTIAQVDKEGYQSWGVTIFALDLKVTNPLSNEPLEVGPSIPDQRYGSPAMVAWWHTLGRSQIKGKTPQKDRQIWAFNMRLPSETDVESGALLETGAAALLAAALRNVRSTQADLASVYGPTRSADSERVRRELWLRTLCAEAISYSPARVSFRRDSNRIASEEVRASRPPQ